MMRNHTYSCLILTICAFRLLSAQFFMKPVFINESLLTPRVVGGKMVELGELPYQVGFKMRKGLFGRNYYTFCGGTIIGEKKVLSAAHCFGKPGSSCFESTVIKGKALINMYAVAGYLYNEGRPKGDNQGGGQWRRLDVVMYPSRYKFPFHADIAVVILKSPFVFNSKVNKIDYARRYQDYRGSCLASGYGRTHQVYEVKSDILLKAELKLITTYWCNLKLRRNTKELICTVSSTTDVAKGDSGGPLVCSNTGDKHEGPYGILVGVVSGNRRNVVTFFTRVSSFEKYIANNRTERNLSYLRSKLLLVVCHCIYLMS